MIFKVPCLVLKTGFKFRYLLGTPQNIFFLGLAPSVYLPVGCQTSLAESLTVRVTRTFHGFFSHFWAPRTSLLYYTNLCTCYVL